MFRIKVPATSANIGPGFDSLGLALNKYNYVNFKPGNEKLKISGNLDKFLDNNNLVYKSYRKTEKYFNKNPKNITIEIETTINNTSTTKADTDFSFFLVFNVPEVI